MVNATPVSLRAILSRQALLAKASHCFLALVTLRGTMLSADMELTILSMSTFAGITGVPYEILRVEPDLFLPFHGGLDGGSWVVLADFVCCAAGFALFGVEGGGLTEVACVDCVDTVASVSLLPLRSRLLAR